ncbi:MAG: metal ABC transporter substrate-binding protein, partial [Dehalococcoidia bacterium]
NANVYKEKVSEMDSYVMAEFGKVTGRAFMTTHDSLAYLEDKYPVSIVGSIIPTLQDSDQLNPADLVEAIETVKEESVRAILVADTVSARFAEAVAEETGVKVVTGLNVEGLVGEGDTYIEFMKRNVSLIVEALSD